jgi:hypothetical protein
MLLRRSLLVPLCLLCGVLVSAAGAETKKKLLLKPQYDPEAPKIGLFEGMEQNAISVQVVPKNAEGGALLVENLTGQPLTVEMPEAIVGVQVLPQDDFGFGGAGGAGGSGSSTSGGQGQNQSFGGGGQGGGFGGQGGGGGFGGQQGFFSIPPERIARVPYTSVCLEHGKPEPRPQNKYHLVRPEQYSSDPALHELLKLVASGKLEKNAAQAAAWHLASGMSWQELANKKFNHVNAPDSPYFHPNALRLAQMIVAESQKRAAEAQKEGDRPEEPQPPIKSRVKLQASR